MFVGGNFHIDGLLITLFIYWGVATLLITIEILPLMKGTN